MKNYFSPSTSKKKIQRRKESRTLRRKKRSRQATVYRNDKEKKGKKPKNETDFSQRQTKPVQEKKETEKEKKFL